MKKFFLFAAIFIIVASFDLSAQVGINSDGSDPDPTAMLDVISNTKGVLIPRMTLTEIQAIAGPANGLMVFNTTDEKFYVFVMTDNVWKEIEYGSNTLPGPFVCGDSFIDARDGQPYQTIQIGSQCWMAENLNIGTMINGNSNQTNNAIIEKYCSNNSTTNCDVYGGLYQWDEAMQYVSSPGTQGICPDGWHFPTDAEWIVLEEEVESTNGVNWNTIGYRGTDAGGNLKETGTTHWNAPNQGATNSSGFTLLPGGYRATNGSFINLNYYANLWSSSEDGSNAWDRAINYNNAQVSRANWSTKAYGYSIRCIQD